MNNSIAQPKKDIQTYLETALSIGKYLVKEAIWYEDKCNWFGHEVSVVNNKYETAVKSCGIEFYSGVTGISLFLAELYKKTKDPIVYHTLNGAINTILYSLEGNTLTNYGYYSGKIGVGFNMWKIGKLIDNQQLCDKGINYIKSIKEISLEDHEIDIVSGAAGSISALLKLFYAEKDNDFLLMATKCGDFLIDKAIKGDGCYSWKTTDQNYALTGFSHGASGMASALLELYATTQEDKYWHASMGGFQYEKKWYSDKAKNWPDLRQYTGEGTPNYGVMWCHGAPGVAIAHIKAYEMTQHEYFLNEAKIALETTRQSVQKEIDNPAYSNFSLCHGLAGNADILLHASEIIKDSTYREIAEKVGDIGIIKYTSTNTVFPSGVNDPSGLTKGQQENPGLMLGLAGTGHFYLRLLDSITINSVLVP